MLSKPLVDKILDEMFLSIANENEFTEKIINDLKALAIQGDLKNSLKIIDIISC